MMRKAIALGLTVLLITATGSAVAVSGQAASGVAYAATGDATVSAAAGGAAAAGTVAGGAAVGTVVGGPGFGTGAGALTGLKYSAVTGA